MEIILVTIAGCAIITNILLWLRLRKIRRIMMALEIKYRDLTDVDEYKSKITTETQNMISERENTLRNLDAQITQLKSDYVNKRITFDKLLWEISLFEDQLEAYSYGLYKPHFDFDTSEKYKQELINIRELEKRIVKEERGVHVGINWTVNGSAAEGKKQTKHYAKLMLRAFNGECEALIADVRWNNANKMAERLQKAFEAINKLGETHQISITSEYCNLKLSELRLAYEYQEKLHREKEEQKRIQEKIRDEERAQREIEKSLKDAEDNEQRYSKALEQARAEMENAHGAATQKMQEKIDRLQYDLENAKAQKIRALSMAQQTKAGNVYIISNIGSFGDNVYKIGMTRRLEPMDRIRELGDASVPFEFDVHAMIYSENAPELEATLHREFDSKRLNLVNDRKEFFRVSLDEIEHVVMAQKQDVEFTRVAEARDYRESIAIRNSNTPEDPTKNRQYESTLPQNL